MPVLKLDLDGETYEGLLARAASERRPVDWQAEVELRRALGLPFPYDPASPEITDRPAAADVAR